MNASIYMQKLLQFLEQKIDKYIESECIDMGKMVSFF